MFPLHNGSCNIATSDIAVKLQQGVLQVEVTGKAKVLNCPPKGIFMVFGVPYREWSSSPSAYSSLSWSATLSCTGFPFTSQMLVSIHTRAEESITCQILMQMLHHFCFPLTVHFDAREAGDLSTLFDVGGIVGKFKASTGRILF